MIVSASEICRRQAGRTYLHIWVLDFSFLLPILTPGTVRTLPYSSFCTDGNFPALHDYLYVIWLTVQTDLQAGAQYKYGVRTFIFLNSFRIILNIML